MDMTVSLKDAGLILIGMGLIVLIGYCIAFMKNLVITIKHTNRILEDAQVVSKMASEKSQEVDKAVSDVAASIGSMASVIKGNQSVISALTSIINALASLKNLLKSKKE